MIIKLKNKYEWHKYFCLFPRILKFPNGDRHFVWLSYIERRYVFDTWDDYVRLRLINKNNNENK